MLEVPFSVGKHSKIIVWIPISRPIFRRKSVAFPGIMVFCSILMLGTSAENIFFDYFFLWWGTPLAFSAATCIRKRKLCLFPPPTEQLTGKQPPNHPFGGGSFPCSGGSISTATILLRDGRLIKYPCAAKNGFFALPASPGLMWKDASWNTNEHVPYRSALPQKKFVSTYFSTWLSLKKWRPGNGWQRRY